MNNWSRVFSKILPSGDLYSNDTNFKINCPIPDTALSRNFEYKKRCKYAVTSPHWDSPDS